MDYQAIAHTVVSENPFFSAEGRPFLPHDHAALEAAIAAALAACARDTIEHCAQVAEVQAGGHYMARICAAAIRALISPA